jgi:predicted nucleic acid-binding Zn ribbon protein
MVPMHGVATTVVAEMIRRQPSSPARTAFAWSVAVGTALARATSRVELHDRILHVTPKDARWAREIERAAPTILARVQRLLGAETVSDLHVHLS